MSENSLDRNSNETENDLIFSDSDILLPSVKELVNKFASNPDQNEMNPKLVDIKRKNSFSDSKINNICRNINQTIQSNNFKVFIIHTMIMIIVIQFFNLNIQNNLD